MTALLNPRNRPRRLRMLLVAFVAAFACVAILASSATAGSTTSVVFTADSYVSADPGATWTIGFTTSSSGALVTGNTVDVTFPSGFDVSRATAAFGMGFSSCTTPTTVINGQTVIVPLTGAGCSLGASTGASLTITGISAAATQYAHTGFRVTTYADSTFTTPIDGIGGSTPSAIDILASVTYSTLASNGSATTGGIAPTDSSSPYSTVLAPTVTVLPNLGGLALTGYTFAGWCTTDVAADPTLCTGTHYAPGDTFSIAANTTLYSQWAVSLAGDGSGEATVSPTSVTESSTGNTLTFTYTAASGSTSLGEVDIVVPSGWSAPTASAAAGCTTASAGSLAFSGQTIQVSGLTLSVGGTLTVTYGATSGGSCVAGDGATAQSSTGTATFTTNEKSTAGGTLGPIASSPTVSVVSVPGAPTGVSASAGNGQATVSWSAPGSTGGAAVSGYTVTSNPDSKTCTWTTGPLSCTVGGLTNGTSYTFTVTATNSAGTGAASTASSGVTPATVPGAPTGVGASAGNGQATVSWSAPGSTGGATITGYTVTSSPDGKTCTWTSGSLSCTVGGLSNGTSYTFTVTATNSAGTGSASGASSGVTPVAPTPSKASTSTTLSASSTAAKVGDTIALTVTVTASSGTPTGAVTVTVAGGTVVCSALSLVSGSASCTTTLTQAGSLSFSATYGGDADFLSSTSSSATVAVRAGVALPAAPTNVTAMQGRSGTTILVSWTASPATGGTVTYTITASDGTQLGQTTATSISVTFASSQVGKAITFTVTPSDSAGIGPSASSGAVTVVDTSALVGTAQTAVSPGNSNKLVQTAAVVVPTASGSSSSSARPTVQAGVEGGGSVTAQAYSSAPVPGATFAVGGGAGAASVTSYFDIQVSRSSTGALPKLVTFSVCSQDLTGQALTWYNPAAKRYQPISPQLITGPRAGSNGKECFIVTITSSQPKSWHPTMAEMGGTVIALVNLDANEIGSIAISSSGKIFTTGSAQSRGSVAKSRLASPITDLATTSDGNGYWVATALGQVINVGDARFFGSLASRHARPLAPVVKVVPTPDNRGYWLVARNGSVYAFGDAKFYGSMSSRGIKPPTSIISMTLTPDAKGYWLAGSDGQVSAFGDAKYHGSFSRPERPYRIVGIAATKDGKGYWLATATGEVFAFGDAKKHGQLKQTLPRRLVTGIVAAPSGGGYSLLSANGAVYGFGDGKNFPVPKGFTGSIAGAAIVRG